MERDNNIMVDLKKQDEEYAGMCYDLSEREKKYLFIPESAAGKQIYQLELA